jgi:UDP-N-acetylglucosamine enolpyruvyl transferase
MPAAAPVSQEILKPLLEIEGGHRLSGELKVSGAKNSALVLMTAALLCNEPLRLNNVPELTDIDGMSEILRALGVQVQRDGSTGGDPRRPAAARRTAL